MYLELIPKLKEIFESVVIHEIPEGDDLMLNVIPHPLGEDEYPDNYPSLIFYPNDYTNEFSSNKSNFKNIKFSAILMVNAENLTNDQLFTFTLPNAADKVVEAVDNQWNGGRIDGHLVWIRTDVGVWGKSVNDMGEVGFVDMDILVKFQTKVD